MRIGIDISRLATNQRTGTERYTAEVLAAIAAAPGAHTYVLYCRELPTALPDLPAQMELRVLPWGALWTHLRLAAELWRDPVDVLFVPSHVVPWNAPFLRRTRVVTTIHDLGFLVFPEAHTTFQNIYLRLTTRWAALVAHRIIAISHATARDLRDYTGIDPARIAIIPHGVAPAFNPSHAAMQPYGRFLLTVGTLQPRKNLRRLIEAFLQMPDTHGTQLVIAGRVGWLDESLAAQVHASPAGKRIHFIGYVPDEQLYGLLASARAFVFPSLYEGFGMPVLEAMASGTAVVCSNTSALPEVAGDAALLFDPASVASITAALTQIDTDDALVTRCVAAGSARVAAYSWARCGAATLQVLEQA